VGRILGLGVTHYPGLLEQDGEMANLLRRTLAGSRVPERARDPNNWPPPMREEWGADGGVAAAQAHRQRCFAAFRAVRERLDTFKPDFVLILGDDQYENFVEDVVPPFCLYVLDGIESRPFLEEEGNGSGVPNIWNDAHDSVFHHRGHAEGARFIANRLSNEGVFIPYAYRLRHPKGLAHAFINTLLYLDVDRRGFGHPVIPLHVNCYGGWLVRSRGGALLQSETTGEPDPPAPSAAACFDLGRALARSLAQSPWRVAIMASSSWSHAFLTAKNDWLFPDHASDRLRFDELREGRLASWREFERGQLEGAGQQEMLNWVVLAGAMSELNLKVEVIDYVETWVLNSNKCFAAWA